jgi:leader peptidase (prepilin peptidase) / N-methyltransferase
MQSVWDVFFPMMARHGWLWIVCIFALGLLVGSFLNVVIHRLPIMLEREWKAQAREFYPPPRGLWYDEEDSPPEPYNLVVPRSACPNCGAWITAAQNVPVVSYVLLRGKCASCGVRVSPRYPIVELVTALLSAAIAWKFGVHWYTAAALALTWSLIALTCIDFDHQLLPDSITMPLLWLGLLISLAGPLEGRWLPPDTTSSVLGAAIGYLVLWSVYHLFKLVTGKEGMGYGDFKLLAALGAWLGWQSLPAIILLSALVGAIVGVSMVVWRGRDRNIPMPFGPYLAGAGWIALMWGEDIMGAYLQLSGMR